MNKLGILISKILLSGYMGAGKSTIGKKLAQLNQWQFIDLDSFIEEKERKSISQIFKEQGEAHFRKLEKQALDSLLKVEKALVISLGGGTVCHSGIAKMLSNNKHVIVCYLKFNPDIICQRLLHEQTKRPLLNEIQDLKSFVTKHINSRTEFYEMADLILDDVESIEESCREIENYRSYLNSSTT